MAENEYFTLQIKLSTSKPVKDVLYKRFGILAHIHNVAVSHVRSTIHRLEADPFYKNLIHEIKALPKKNLTAEQRAWKGILNRALKAIRQDYGLTAYGLHKWITPCARQHYGHLCAQQIHKEMNHIAKAIDAYFYGNGKEIHFKRTEDFCVIPGKAPHNVRFNRETFSIDFKGLHIPCKMPKQRKSRKYIEEALKNEIRYCSIKRLMFSTGWHYYVVLTLKGRAPATNHPVGKETAGYDPGVSTAALTADSTVFLEELAPRTVEYNEKINDLSEKMESSRRLSNPAYYNEDGTIKKGKKIWIYSHTYRKDRKKRKALFRKKSAYTHQECNRLANVIIATANHIIAEPVNFLAMAKRAKKTERQEKPSTILDRQGREKEIYKNKRKKRYGKSILDRCPAYMYSTLRKKAILTGGSFIEINTRSYKASQYDHITRKCTEAPLNQRFKMIGGQEVQRDLYSAFLIRYPAKNLKEPDFDECEKHFEHFVRMQNQKIKELKNTGISMNRTFSQNITI